MTKEITQNLMCVVFRNGIEMWREESRIQNLIKLLKGSEKEHRFIKLDDELINTADIVGIFTPTTMSEFSKRKNGQWKCGKGNWHERGKKCECQEKPRCIKCGSQIYTSMIKSGHGVECMDCWSNRN